MPAYATSQELAEYLHEDEPPEDAERLLERASEVVDGLLIGAIYDTDDDDMPTSNAVRETLRKATCAQVDYWLESGGSEHGAVYSQASIGNVSLTRAGANRRGEDIAPHAITVLRTGGLLPVLPLQHG